MLTGCSEAISTHAPAGGATPAAGIYAERDTDFYSRPCGRGDERRPAFSAVRPYISTHAPAGGATTSTAGTIREDIYISTHAPAGGATWTTGTWPGAKGLFLLTPLREGRRDLGFFLWLHPVSHFYSRPCGRGDLRRFRQRHPVGISTHAPAGGATFTCSECGNAESNISTHAPAGGATERHEQPGSNPWHFYSRPCGRGDLLRRGLQHDAHTISTHAPAGGATWCGKKQEARRNRFLLTPLREGRLRPQFRRFWMDTFLLTPLREGRPARRVKIYIPDLHFYSRPCGRGDHSAFEIRPRRWPISTHAPAGGATQDGFLAARRLLPFLLTPLREGRLGIFPLAPSSVPFLLTPLREGRLIPLRIPRDRLCISTHAPAGGATETGGRNQQPGNQFLLTPLREGRQEAKKRGNDSSDYFYSRPCGRGDEV